LSRRREAFFTPKFFYAKNAFFTPKMHLLRQKPLRQNFLTPKKHFFTPINFFYDNELFFLEKIWRKNIVA